MQRFQVWVPVKDAALVLGVDRSTNTRWVQAGEINTKKERLVTMVEIGECRAYKILTAARRNLNLL